MVRSTKNITRATARHIGRCLNSIRLMSTPATMRAKPPTSGSRAVVPTVEIKSEIIVTFAPALTGRITEFIDTTSHSTSKHGGRRGRPARDTHWRTGRLSPDGRADE